MRLIVLEEAASDINEGEAWYGRIDKGLRTRFRADFRDSVRRIRSNPHAYAEVEPGVRKIQLRHFPFLIYYQISEGQIILIACIYGGRSPGSWFARKLPL